MRRLLFAILLIPSFCYAQDDMKKKAFYTLINSLISHSVTEVKADELEPSDVVWLDAREQDEYDVSRIEGAQFVGYDDFKIKAVKDIEKEAEIIVYCSIGYRSEKVAEKLEKAGYTNVKNLYGGIFDWHNSGKSVVDSLGNPTNKIHGYGRTWGVWLNDAETVY
ncbi:MAG: rhodanese-like domain-containing protein [Reichenbachiella sp.]|uniref:rhodanese-like domain-containing protein n=1 Tax=Reichenbachiella sp. TaxID=2184521 RepID=UPI003296981E